jgi:hypothetical protein
MSSVYCNGIATSKLDLDFNGIADHVLGVPIDINIYSTNSF